jgi:hypothetical protein
MIAVWVDRSPGARRVGYMTAKEIGSASLERYWLAINIADPKVKNKRGLIF